MFAVTILLQYSSGSTSQCNKARKEEIKKEEINGPYLQMTWLPVWKNPKEFTKAFLELINKFSKVTGYKFNTQK